MCSSDLFPSHDNPNNDPKNWILQGSNDNVEWTNINSQTEILFDSRCERKEFREVLSEVWYNLSSDEEQRVSKFW